MQLTDDIQKVKGIGEKTALLFRKAGILSVRDLLNYFPRTYEVYQPPISVMDARYRDFGAIYGVLTQNPVTRYVKKFKITDAFFTDEAGKMMKVSWFNMPYLQKTLHAGAAYVFSGKIEGNGTLRIMKQPKVFRPEEYKELQKTLSPVYPLVRGLTSKMIQNAVKEVFAAGITLGESLSQDLIRDYGFLPLSEAVSGIHFPTSRDSFMEARKRLVFEEFYRFSINVKQMKENAEKAPNSFSYSAFSIASAQKIKDSLPYALTGAQERTLNEIFSDLQSAHLMNRLIQGDVGSGKTIVAFLSMAATAFSGYLSAMMAPTEVLARQHYENFKKLSDSLGLDLNVSLLVGSQTAKEKKEVYELIASHKTDIVVGTHALIQEKAHYTDLALVVTDEQHRFGVNQRKALSEKGQAPHVLVMSATPIPRTLAMILYGDMDISVMDEKPRNRLPIKNALVDIEYRGKAYSFIRKQVEEGHQAYVICPMVEESEISEGENVQDYAKILRTVLPSSIHVGVLHGKMKPDEKEEIMAAFSRNEIQVLVSTTVIEVGIDVPNATVMMIENAERFGLAQLHQLRGRVGRGDAQSYCIFIDTTQSEESKERLSVLKNSTDGFEIASKDLSLRGPGDFFGIRQSGELLFRLGDIYKDADLLKKAQEAAQKTAPGTELPEKVIL